MQNVALVVFDTLRYDVFTEYFDWLPGTWFTDARTISNYTVPAHASLFTGRYPSEIGVTAKSERLPADEPVLAERLENLGYTARAYTANPLITEYLNFDRGFSEFKKSPRLQLTDPDVFDWMGKSVDPGVRGTSTLLLNCLRANEVSLFKSLKSGIQLKRTSDKGAKRALEYVRETDFGEKEFLFMNLMEVHRPYQKIPDNHRSVNIDPLPETEVAALLHGEDCTLEDYWQVYKDAAQYLSDVYESIFTELAQSFDVVITTADHGELFGEHDSIGHFFGVFDELTHVPLVVYDGTDSREYRNDVVNTIDLYNTVLKDATDDGPPNEHPLHSKTDARERLVEYTGLRKDKIVGLRDSGFSEEKIDTLDRPLYAIATDNGYAYQTVDGIETLGRIEEPESRIDEKISLLNERVSDDEGEMNDEIRSQLEFLGYV